MCNINIESIIDSLMDNYAEYRKNKIMIIDANTGQGKTSAAINWSNKIISNKELLPEGIEDVKIFYFTPQKNNWPIQKIVENEGTKNKSAFLFSQLDTFEYLIKQYMGKGSKENSIKLFMGKLNNRHLQRLVCRYINNDERMLYVYSQYKIKAMNFITTLFEDNSENKIKTSKSFNEYAEITKELISLIYGNNTEKIKEEILNKNNKAFSFLYDLFSSMLIFDKKYNVFISSVDKMLNPLETIIYGKISFKEIRKIFGEKTLIVIFIDEWDKAYERFSAYNHKKNSKLTYSLFKTIRYILQINTDNLPNKYLSIGKRIKYLQKQFLSKYPKANLDTYVDCDFKVVMKNDFVLSCSKDKYFNITNNSNENINKITTDMFRGTLLENMILDSTILLNNIISAIKEESWKIEPENASKRENIKKYLLSFMRLNEIKYINEIYEDIELHDNDIVLAQSNNEDIEVTTTLSSTERMLNKLIQNRNGLSPTLLIGMSATANYNTVINNFKINNITDNDSILYKIPINMASEIKNNYAKKNNYGLQNNEVNEHVKTVGSKWQNVNSKTELYKMFFKDEKSLREKLNKILEDKKQTELIFKELNSSISKINEYTIKNIMSMATAMVDAKTNGVRSMMLFSTNSYQSNENKTAIIYMYALRLIEENIIKNKEELLKCLKNDTLFINAESFKNEDKIQKVIDENKTCFIITSYMSASRGINLMQSISKKDIEEKIVKKIDPEKENPKAGNKVDIQAIYLEKPTYLIPQIPTGTYKMNDTSKIEIIDILFRLYDSGSIDKKDLIYWLSIELNIPNNYDIKSAYPTSSKDGKIAAIKTAVQAMGRRTRTPYRFEKCYTYINHSFLIDYPWEDALTFSELSENMQIKKLVETKKALI